MCGLALTDWIFGLDLSCVLWRAGQRTSLVLPGRLQVTQGWRACVTADQVSDTRFACDVDLVSRAEDPVHKRMTKLGLPSLFVVNKK